MGHSTSNPYAGLRTEIDLRLELDRMFDGFGQEIAKKQTGLLRIMRRDVDGKPIYCPCVTSPTGEPDRDYKCPICLSEGFLWDERATTLYRMHVNPPRQQATEDRYTSLGVDNVPPLAFYFRWPNDITIEDRVVELMLDKEGAPAIPLRRKAIYVINTLVEYRSDNGRLEYWQASVMRHNTKWL